MRIIRAAPTWRPSKTLRSPAILAARRPRHAVRGRGGEEGHRRVGGDRHRVQGQRDGPHRAGSAGDDHGRARQALQDRQGLVTGTTRPRLYVAVALLATLAAAPAWAADYAGPLVDAHSHVPNAAAIDAYVAAMKRHNVTRVILLGVGGVQKDDAAWIAAAMKKHPDRVVAGQPVADPTAASAAARLDGEIAVRQVSRKIERSPAEAAFVKVLEVAARHKTQVVIHDELNADATTALEAALSAVPSATIVLAHGGESAPAALEALLG